MGTSIQAEVLPSSIVMSLMICKLRWFSGSWGLCMLTDQQEKKGSLYLQAQQTQCPQETGLLHEEAMFKIQGMC